MTDKETYEKKLKAQLDAWQAEIDKLRAQAQEAQADARVRYHDQIENLRRHRDDVEGKLKELQAAQSEAWKDIKAGADRAWDDMSRAMTDAMNRFG